MAMYELFYSGGGHGGPYQSLTEAREAAKRLLKGGTDYSISIKPYSSTGASGYGHVIDTIRRKDLPTENPSKSSVLKKLRKGIKGHIKISRGRLIIKEMKEIDLPRKYGKESGSGMGPGYSRK